MGFEEARALKFREFGRQHRHWLWPAGLSAALVGFFLLLTEELGESHLQALDASVQNYFLTLRHAAWNGIMVDLTALGSLTLLIIFCLFGMLLFSLLRDFRGAVSLLAGSLGALFLSAVVKKIVGRPRPAVEHLVEVSGHSYPSGHSLGATAVYFLLMLLVVRHFPRVGARAALFLATSLLILAIATSRLYLGVHYFSDVTGGILLGGGWACLVAAGAALGRPGKLR